MKVSAFANDESVITVGSVTVFVTESGYGDDLESSTDPTPSVYAQIMEMIDRVGKNVDG